MDPTSRLDQLEAITQGVRALTKQSQDNPLELLAILRLLDGLHREIAEGDFQSALPQTRQDLYQLLREIEVEGGWPHIPRLKLQRLLANLSDESEVETKLPTSP